jgi:hypothetical protein
VGKRTLPEANGVAERAERLAELHADLHKAFDRRSERPDGRDAWLRATERFNEAYAEFYGPYPAVVRGIHDGHRDAMAEGLRFLAADPWCFRSGYLKADLMDAFANTRVPPDLVDRLQAIVVRRVTHPEPRLLRSAAHLASNVWSDALRERLEALALDGDAAVAERAHAVIEGARHRTRSLTPRDKA